MNKTYILGAGSSVEFGYPLGNNIFSVAKEKAYSHQELSKSKKAQHLRISFEEVEKGLKTVFQNLPEDHYWWPNYEELYTFVERELVMPGGPRVNGINEDLRNNLRDMLFQLIGLCGFTPLLEKSELSDIYKKFIEKIIGNIENRNIKFINFNYDILLPYALKELSYIPDYGFECHDMESGELLKFSDKSVDLVVPHGALNIAECKKCKKKLFSSSPVISMIKNERAFCPICQNSLVESHLAPPNYNKYINNNKDVKRIISFLSNSTDICIIGYSFPSYDYYFKYLFQIALANNPHQPRIEIIDLGTQQQLEDKYGFFRAGSDSLSYFGDGFMNYIKLKVQL